ncbi:hypothetical protein MLD38_037192 [Melastoma candidum]|uniref:Uncharacterized protein n=1 Tax=Melastoma candidum TaxID=119954 RepID=A0ACB9LMB0_9MYRT|nr:hypothetical protein MLD38_037192 [Melastoma candidum]
MLWILMGGSRSDKPIKEPSATTSAPAPAITPDWSGFQAYSPIPPPPGFLASSPHGQPYMWGFQVKAKYLSVRILGF